MERVALRMMFSVAWDGTRCIDFLVVKKFWRRKSRLQGGAPNYEVIGTISTNLPSGKLT